MQMQPSVPAGADEQDIDRLMKKSADDENDVKQLPNMMIFDQNDDPLEQASLKQSQRMYPSLNDPAKLAG